MSFPTTKLRCALITPGGIAGIAVFVGAEREQEPGALARRFRALLRSSLTSPRSIDARVPGVSDGSLASKAASESHDRHPGRHQRHTNPRAADIYHRARARGCTHPHAIRILGRAWCAVIWRIWHDHTAYDHTTYDHTTYDHTTYDHTTYDHTTYDPTLHGGHQPHRAAKLTQGVSSLLQTCAPTTRWRSRLGSRGGAT